MKKALCMILLMSVFVLCTVTVVEAKNYSLLNENDITAALNTYFEQRHEFLRGSAPNITCANAPLVVDQFEHLCLLLNDNTIERVSMQIQIDEILLADAFASAVVSEYVTFLKSGVEITETIEHIIELYPRDSYLCIAADGYFETTSGFKSGCYIDPDTVNPPGTNPTETEPTETEPTETEPSVSEESKEPTQQNSTSTQVPTTSSVADKVPTPIHEVNDYQWILWVGVAFIAGGAVGSLVTMLLGRKRR